MDVKKNKLERFTSDGFCMENFEKFTLQFFNIHMNIKAIDRDFSDILYPGRTYETFPNYNAAFLPSAENFCLPLLEFKRKDCITHIAANSNTVLNIIHKQIKSVL